MTLIELMIAITIALIILAAMSWIFVGNSRARAETERENQQIDNGSYAMQQITFDLQMAGYWAEYNIGVAIASGTLATPAALPNPCDTALATLRTAMPLSVQGYDLNSGGLTCINDYKANTDVLVVRRVSGCVAGTANCAPGAGDGRAYFQAALCAAEVTSIIATDQFRLDRTALGLDRHKRDCTTAPPGTLADQHEVLTHIYYVANDDQGADGIPTLKRAEMNAAGAFDTVSIAQGVENMQFEYGIDDVGNRVPSVFKADPINYVAAPCTAVPCVINFQNTVAVDVHLLVRNPSATPGYVDNKTYTLGLDATDTPQTVAAAGQTYRRHVYNGAVRLINQAIR